MYSPGWGPGSQVLTLLCSNETLPHAATFTLPQISGRIQGKSRLQALQSLPLAEISTGITERRRLR
jgi:hypothetical protein